MIVIRAAFLLICVIAVGYAALRLWRRRNGASASDGSDGFRPTIGFSRLDGMESLSLLLENKSRAHVWAEEIEIHLGNLVAENQSCEAPLHGILKIRQMIRVGDMLPISLAGAIYKAAGEPQRKHSSILSSVLRYRIGEECFEKNLENYRIQMIGLTASGVQRDRNAVPRIQKAEEPQPVHAMASKEK
jgi:hypothetical protein